MSEGTAGVLAALRDIKDIYNPTREEADRVWAAEMARRELEQ